MAKSKSARQQLADDLLAVATKHRSTPSVLLSEFEQFLAYQGVAKKKTIDSFRMPRWQILGFDSQEELDKFESRPDFPGWEAL